MNNSTIEAIIIASSLTQTRETHQEYKYIIDADITNVNCSDSEANIFFVRYTRMHRCLCMRVKTKKSITFNDDIITHSHSLYSFNNTHLILYTLTFTYDIFINLNFKFLWMCTKKSYITIYIACTRHVHGKYIILLILFQICFYVVFNMKLFANIKQ